MFQIKNVSKSYDDFKLDKVSIKLEDGDIFGVLGPNGSGKTTLVKILTGQTKFDSGDIRILDIDPKKDPIKLKEKIGIVPEQESPPSFLTVFEYLEFVSKIRKIKDYESKINYFLKFLNFEKEKNRLIRDLSRGTKQKVLIAQAFIHDPKVVFIDEPLVNLDPIMQKKVKEFLVDYAKKGNIILVSTHILSIVDDICNKISILKEGRNIFTGKIEEIKGSLEDFFIKEFDQK